MANQKVMTCLEVAAVLGLSLSRVHHLIRDGRLKATKFGARAWTIKPKDVDAVRVRKGKRGPVGKTA